MSEGNDPYTDEDIRTIVKITIYVFYGVGTFMIVCSLGHAIPIIGGLCMLTLDGVLEKML